jgi:hypothetical protein
MRAQQITIKWIAVSVIENLKIRIVSYVTYDMTWSTATVNMNIAQQPKDVW